MKYSWWAICGFAIFLAHILLKNDQELSFEHGFTLGQEILGIWEPDFEATKKLDPTIVNDVDEFVSRRSIDHLRVFFFKQKDSDRINFQYWSKEFRIYYSGEVELISDGEKKSIAKFKKVKTFNSEAFDGLGPEEFRIFEDSKSKFLRIDTFFGLSLVLRKVPVKKFEELVLGDSDFDWRLDREFTLTKWNAAGVVVENDDVLPKGISLQIKADTVHLEGLASLTSSLKIHLMNDKGSQVVLYCLDDAETGVNSVLTIFKDPFRSELWLESRDGLPLYFSNYSR